MIIINWLIRLLFIVTWYVFQLYSWREQAYKYLCAGLKPGPDNVPVWSQDRNFLQNISWYFLCSIVVVRFVDICRTDDHHYLNILFIKIVIHTSKQRDTGMGIHTMLWLSQRKGRYCGYRTRKRLSYYITLVMTRQRVLNTLGAWLSFIIGY